MRRWSMDSSIDEESDADRSQETDEQRNAYDDPTDRGAGRIRE